MVRCPVRCPVVVCSVCSACRRRPRLRWVLSPLRRGGGSLLASPVLTSHPVLYIFHVWDHNLFIDVSSTDSGITCNALTVWSVCPSLGDLVWFQCGGGVGLDGVGAEGLAPSTSYLLSTGVSDTWSGPCGRTCFQGWPRRSFVSVRLRGCNVDRNYNYQLSQSSWLHYFQPRLAL